MGALAWEMKQFCQVLMQNYFIFTLLKVELKAKNVYSQTLFGGLKTTISYLFFSLESGW